jgi:outer membrane biosynthesis protein TonB
MSKEWEEKGRMRKRWSKKVKRYKTVFLIAGACFVLIAGIVFTVHVSKLKQKEEKVSTELQTTEEKRTETEAVEQEATQAAVTETQEEESKTSVEEKQKKLKQPDTRESVDREGKKKKGTEAGQEKEKEKSDSVKKDSKNKKNETKEQSQEKQEEPKTEREVSQSPKQKEAEKEEKSYVPVSEGWKAAKSVKGDITFAQKAALDAMVEVWRSGSLSDSELKTKIMEYLEEQKITCTEVSVTSQGYALYSQVPEIELSDGGNYYSFVGTYSTGKQNPDGTEKTIFYNWSVFVF